MKQMTYILIPSLIFLLMAVMIFCSQPVEKPNAKKQPHKYTNHLAKETSPYLLMHAHNPVDWHPWGQEALEKAKKENKLLIVSIGYAACHWCHVMERESFEDEEVAELMNKHFVSIKVDREERPDVDQVYMDAAHLLTGSGGWPLNAIALPDGRPIFAGTYYPKDRWIMLLKQLHKVYSEQPDRAMKQAESVTEGIQKSGMIGLNPSPSDFDPDTPDETVASWISHMDYQWGGEMRSPKFPLPIGYRYLMSYYHMTRNSATLDRAQGDKALEIVTITLDRMAMGGIYDQVGGGFARYSTDEHWKAPHFEKMLYDNGQLVSLYSYAYQQTKNPLYKSVVYETLEFVKRELTSPKTSKGGKGFYSSLDADSEGVEGKFYIWSEKELKDLLGKDAGLLMDYYNADRHGNWEHGQNILWRTESDEEFAKEKKITVKALQEAVARAKPILLKARSKRVRPPLDDKILTAWNGLMLTGYVDAYRVFDDESFLKQALSNAEFISRNMMSKDGRLDRNFKNGNSTINAFLDDYAFTIQAFISLYQATFDEKWLFTAEKLLKYTLDHFFDSKSGMFYYTSDQDAKLIARKMETSDNVIPASTSQMAINLFLLGEYFYNEDYIKKSRQMLTNVKENLGRHGPYYANWSLLMNYFISPPAEVAILGDDWQARRKELDRHFLPNVILMGGKTEGKLPLLKLKLQKGQTTIYVCRNKACKLPVTDTRKALKQLGL
ncbi:MAG: thioredoxin domain-containing protein [bacterium]|nr:thioredoxin domain-containing protein [bacterium]